MFLQRMLAPMSSERELMQQNFDSSTAMRFLSTIWPSSLQIRHRSIHRWGPMWLNE